MSGDFSHVNDVIKMRSLSIRLSKLMTQSMSIMQSSSRSLLQVLCSTSSGTRRCIARIRFITLCGSIIVWQHLAVFVKVYPNIFKTSQ